MAKIYERQKAYELRKKELSYNQIKSILNVSKSTLSNWLRDYPLSRERIRKLRDINAIRIEKYRETMRKKRDKRLNSTYLEEKQKLLSLSKRELYIAGLFLYWGEGTKDIQRQILLSNSDPEVIKFGLYWLEKILKVPKEKMKIRLHLYSDMNIESEQKYWSNELNLPLGNFKTPYIKKSKRKHINHKGFGHGTCNLEVGDVRLKEKIMMALQCIIDNYYLKSKGQ